MSYLCNYIRLALVLFATGHGAWARISDVLKALGVPVPTINMNGNANTNTGSGESAAAVSNNNSSASNVAAGQRTASGGATNGETPKSSERTRAGMSKRTRVKKEG